MEIFLGVLVVTWALKTFITDVQYAAKGQVPPRRREGPRRQRFGTPGRSRYGFRDLLADAWFDGCERTREWQVARRERGKDAGSDEAVDRLEKRPSRLRWFADAAKRTGRLLIEPVGETAPEPVEDQPVAEVDAGSDPVEVKATPGPDLATSGPNGSCPMCHNSGVVDGGLCLAPVCQERTRRLRAAAMPRPKVGERNTDGRTLEWTGDVWAPVCSRCDIPMGAHDGSGWLCCGTCGLRARDDRGGQSYAATRAPATRAPAGQPAQIVTPTVAASCGVDAPRLRAELFGLCGQRLPGLQPTGAANYCPKLAIDGHYCVDHARQRDIDSRAAEQAQDQQAPRIQPGGSDMGTATGEAVNYEQALHQIDLMQDDLRDIGTHLEGVDSEVNDLSAAASTFGQHLAALDLDADTLTPVSLVTDALRPDELKDLFDKIDAARVALDAARDHIVATYSDAAQSVATNLSGNPEFLAA